MNDPLLEAGLFLIEGVLLKGGFIITAQPRKFVLTPPERTEMFTEKERRLTLKIENILFDNGGALLASRHLRCIGGEGEVTPVGRCLCGTGTGTFLVREVWMHDEQTQTVADKWNPRNFQHEDEFTTVFYLVSQNWFEKKITLPPFRNLAATP